MGIPVAKVLVFVSCLLCGICRARIRTCRDIESENVSNEKAIEKLKAELEECKLGHNTKDVSSECTGFQTCSACLRTNDNLNCGWCFRHQRCSPKQYCPGNDSDSNSWIPNGGDRCPRISKVTPYQVPYGDPKELKVNILHLPVFDGDFVCAFEILGKSITSKAERIDNDIACLIPLGETLPEIPGHLSSIPVKVSVRTNAGPDLVPSANITIYICSSYESCTDCASSPFPCSWCTGEDRCTYDADENCLKDIIIGSEASSRPSTLRGSDFCSRILPNPPSSLEEILVTSGTKRRISVKVQNTTPFQVSARFHCRVQGHARVTAQLLGDTVYCNVIEFKVWNHEALSNVTFDVYWDGKKMDNPQKMHFIVYDCSLLATSCGACMEVPERYNCRWSEKRNSCMVHEKRGEFSWSGGMPKCLKPDITWFHPKTGLITQETNITIEGVNFGKEFKDIAFGVNLVSEEGDLIAQCKPYEELYVPTTRIVCSLNISELPPDEVNGTLKGFFQVRVSGFLAVTKDEFSFVNPVITGINPVKGVKSGGTFLEIQGSHLDAGSTAEAFVGDFPCKITSRHSNSIKCVTSASKRTLSSAVRVVFDGAERISPSYFFYVKDPWIRSVKTEFLSDGPIGTPRGGNLVIVEGEHLDHVNNPPYIYIVVDEEEFIGACSVQSPTKMKCINPRVPAERLNFCGDEGFVPLHYGFRMDMVEDVQNMSAQGGFEMFHMYSDPFFLPFEEEGKIKVFVSDYLHIKGRNIDRVFSENDIVIEIGSDKCVLTSLSSSQLTCRPPSTQPPAKDGHTTRIPEVVVRVMDSMEFFIGFLRYNLSSP